MKRSVILLVLSLFAIVILKAQKADSSYFIALNQQIDNAVVRQDIAALDSLYANDFVLSHGTGKVEGKAGWLATAKQVKYTSRLHDSVIVELHPDVVFVRGHLAVQRIDGDKIARYHVDYIRLYGIRGKRWQMVSHYTTKEWHEL
jgi:ketosteroid isomerase-like protein